MAYQTIPPGAGSDPWVTSQQAFLRGVVPQINRVEYMYSSMVPVGNTSAVALAGDAAKEGGAVGGITTNVIRAFTGGIFQTLNTGRWGIVWRGKAAAPVNGRTVNVGLINLVNSHGVYIRTAFATDTTHWIVEFAGATTTDTVVGTADNNIHNFGLTGNATTITMWVDGVQSGSPAVIDTNVVDESVGLFLSATTLTDAYVSRVMWGYVDPTV